MMMVFGLFVFELRTLPYQQLQLSRNWRHVKNDRVGRSPKWQYVGAGENQLTLGGLLYPEITAWQLVAGCYLDNGLHRASLAADRWRRLNLRDVCNHGVAGNASGVRSLW